jgi:hypothetical protein
MGLALSGYLLDPPRVGAANSPYTQTPNVYISDSVAFNAAYPSDESAPRTEYHVFVLKDGDFPDATFAWTKNEVINRFDYDSQVQRFRTLPGAAPEVVGTLGPTSNVDRLVVAIPGSSNLVSYPVRVSVGSAVGTALTVVLVALDTDLNAPDPPLGSVQLSQESGKLGWAPADLVTYNGQTVRYQRQSFFTRDVSMGKIGVVGDTLVLNPLPATGQYPLIRFGSGEYLTPIEVVSFGAVPVGAVEWDRNTGEIRFNAGETWTYAGYPVYYDGAAFGFGLTVPIYSLGTVSAPGILGPLPPEASDVFFRVPGVVQFSTTTFVDALTPFPTYGQRDVVEIKRSTGSVQFSFVDQILYGPYSVQAVVADLYIERGMTLRMFRTPVDPKATDATLKDVAALYPSTDSVWASPIIGSPTVSLPALPVDGQPLTVKVAQGTGTYPEGDLNRLDVPSPPAGYGFMVDFEKRQLLYARRLEGQVLSASQSTSGDTPGRKMMLVRGPYGALQLPNPIVSHSNLKLELEDTSGGGALYPSTTGWTELVLGDTALFDHMSGLITLTDTEGVVQTSGTGGSFAGTLFTDISQDFSTAGVQSGDFLLVLSGTPAGVYTIDAVGTTTLTTDLPGGTVSGLSYEIRRGSEVMADRYFKEVPPADPNTRVERLWNLGSTTNSPRLVIDPVYISASRFRFGLSTFSTSTVPVPTSASFTAPASLGQGIVEVAEDTGELNFSQFDVNAGLVVYWSRTLVVGTDYRLQPPLGFIEFTTRMLEQEEVYLTYVVLDDNSNRVTVEERGTFIVRKEVTADHPTPTGTLSFNPLGREVASNPAPKAFRGGRPQVTGKQVTFDVAASTVTFIETPTVTDALPSGPTVGPTERVYVDYFVYGAVGGEKSLTVLQPPMVGAMVNITADETSFVVIGDQTTIYKTNRLLRVNKSEVYLIGSVAYDAGADSTTVTLASPQKFLSDQLNPTLDVTSGATRVNTSFFFPSYFTTELNTWVATPRGSSKVYISGDFTRTYVSGTILLFTDGGTFVDFNLVTGSTYSALTRKTEVVLTSNGARQYNPSVHTLKHSKRPILEGPKAEVTTLKNPVLAEPYQVYRRVEGSPGILLVQPDDYTITDSGLVSFTDPLQDNEELGIFYMGTVMVEAGRRIRASYIHAIAPSMNNGLAGQVLKADYTTYAPDTFYWRVETFTNFRGELVAKYEGEAQASIPTGGPVLENASQPKLYEQGRESLFYQEGRLYNEDEVARPTLKYYNDGINYIEDCLQHMDGRVVGDHDGRFLFDGLITNPVRPTYADVTNQIDDILKIAEPPLQVTLNPFSFSWVGTYQEAYKAATFSRFYPTYRATYGVTIAGVSTGDTILDTKLKNFSSVLAVSRRLPWSIVTKKAKVGDTMVYVDSTAREDDLFRPAMDPLGHPFVVPPIMLVVIQNRDGTWLHDFTTYLTVSTVTAGSITFGSSVLVDIPVGATIYHIPVYLPVIAPSPMSPYLKVYRGSFDVLIDLQGGTLQYLQPFFPFDGTISPAPIPTELTIQPPVQEEILDVFAYLNNTLTEPYRFPALDGGTADDDGNRSFPLLTPSPESEIGRSKTVNGSPIPHIGYSLGEEAALNSIVAYTANPLYTTGDLDVARTTITKVSGNWPSPVPKIGDLVEIRSGLNALSGYHWIVATTANSLTINAAHPFALQDTGFYLQVTVATSLVARTGTLTTTTQLDDAGANFITAGVKPGHTVVVNSLMDRRQVVAVNSATQLIVEPFSTTGAVTYKVDNSLATYGGTNSLLPDVVDDLAGQLDVLRDNAPPTKPWAELEALERFFEHVFTDVLTSTQGSTQSGLTTLTDVTADFVGPDPFHPLVTPASFVYIRSGTSAGVYAVSVVNGPTSLDVATDFPFPDTGSGISYRIVSSLGLGINTLQAVYAALAHVDRVISEVATFQSLMTTAVTVVDDAGAFARRTLDSDINDPTTGRLTQIGRRQTELDPTVGDIPDLESALSSGDRLYDKRFTWIDARINLEKGILPKKDRAVANRLKAQAETLKQLIKILTLRSL